MIGLNNNSDSDSENIGTQDKEATITKKQRGEGKTYFFSETFASLELAKKAVEEEGTWSWSINFDFNSSNSHQSYSTTKTFSTLTNVNLSSLAHISNNELQFNAVNNYSMNLSTYQPQIDSEDEDEDVVEDMVVKNAVVVEAKKVEAKKRGRPPLTEDQKEKNAAKKAATKAAKRAKKDQYIMNIYNKNNKIL